MRSPYNETVDVVCLFYFPRKEIELPHVLNLYRLELPNIMAKIDIYFICNETKLWFGLYSFHPELKVVLFFLGA
jgi:hypothetical protein